MDDNRHLENIRHAIQEAGVYLDNIRYILNRMKFIAQTPSESYSESELNHANDDGMKALMEEAEDNGIWNDLKKLQKELDNARRAIDLVGQEPPRPAPGQLKLPLGS